MSDCPEFEQCLRWRDAGDSQALEAHLARCTSCAAAWAELAVLTERGRALPDGRPDQRRRESVRTRILAQAEAQVEAPRRPASMPWVLLAAALVLGVAGWWLWPAGAVRAGEISAPSGAVFALQQPGPDEIVALSEGAITVQVAHLAPDQRFRVFTTDAEVEVRGTRFTVRATEGRLQAVVVQEGVVEVRPKGAAMVRLAAGERWAAPALPTRIAPMSAPASAVRAPVRVVPSAARARAEPAPRIAVPATAAPAPAAPAVAPVSVAPRVEAPGAPASVAPASVAPAAPKATPQTVQFEAGWQALRVGTPRAAAVAFEAAARLEGPLRADAAWWHVVALGRAGDDAASRGALERYLKAYPASKHRAEASVMLGWLDFTVGRVDAAERAFRAGRQARRAAVRAQAEAGLKAVADWRAR